MFTLKSYFSVLFDDSMVGKIDGLNDVKEILCSSMYVNHLYRWIPTSQSNFTLLDIAESYDMYLKGELSRTPELKNFFDTNFDFEKLSSCNYWDDDERKECLKRLGDALNRGLLMSNQYISKLSDGKRLLKSIFKLKDFVSALGNFCYDESKLIFEKRINPFPLVWEERDESYKNEPIFNQAILELLNKQDDIISQDPNVHESGQIKRFDDGTIVQCSKKTEFESPSEKTILKVKQIIIDRYVFLTNEDRECLSKIARTATENLYYFHQTISIRKSKTEKEVNMNELFSWLTIVKNILLDLSKKKCCEDVFIKRVEEHISYIYPERYLEMPVGDYDYIQELKRQKDLSELYKYLPFTIYSLVNYCEKTPTETTMQQMKSFMEKTNINYKELYGKDESEAAKVLYNSNLYRDHRAFLERIYFTTTKMRSINEKKLTALVTLFRHIIDSCNKILGEELSSGVNYRDSIVLFINSFSSNKRKINYESADLNLIAEIPSLYSVLENNTPDDKICILREEIVANKISTTSPALLDVVVRMLLNNPKLSYRMETEKFYR